MLLFANQALSCHIRVGRFKDLATILDDRQITQPLFVSVHETKQAVKNHLSLSYHFDGRVKRVET
jgi:predicted HTH transcriptional regulator